MDQKYIGLVCEFQWDPPSPPQGPPSSYPSWTQLDMERARQCGIVRMCPSFHTQRREIQRARHNKSRVERELRPRSSPRVKRELSPRFSPDHFQHSEKRVRQNATQEEFNPFHSQHMHVEVRLGSEES